MGLLRLAACLLLAAAAACSVRRSGAQDLATYIDTLRAIDSHAHPMAYVAAGVAADTDYDALPLDGLPPFEAPLGLRASNPAYLDAQRAFYGTSGGNPGT